MNSLLSSGKLLVFSPHLDDAVFSCGELIAAHTNVEVVTVFAALPKEPTELSSWDAASGFHSAQEAIAQRRQEDDAALSALDARPRHLDFCDSQYHATPSQKTLRACLDQVLQASMAKVVLLPAGLFHSDHVLLHQVLIEIWRRHPKKIWLMYEEALYRRVPGLLQQRLSALERENVRATPIEFVHEEGVRLLKRAAVECYASQLRALTDAANGYADVFMPERYWLLDPCKAERKGAFVGARA